MIADEHMALTLLFPIRKRIPNGVGTEGIETGPFWMLLKGHNPRIGGSQEMPSNFLQTSVSKGIGLGQNSCLLVERDKAGNKYAQRNK